MLMSESVDQHWDARFFERSPLFEPLRPCAEGFFQQDAWPELDEYRNVFSQQGMDVMPVVQDDRPQDFEALYESRIFLQGELQTRLHNWHDFFNALVWLSFPHTKQALNTLHFQASMQREPGTNRSPLENLLTLFDECGAVIISRRADLLQMIRDRQWQSLFVDHRSVFEADLRCVVFGHAMYEKALQPYVGMTTHTLLIESETLLQGDLKQLDMTLSHQWFDDAIQSKQDLVPFPLLGVPGWYAPNRQPDFYDNQDYFRP